VDENGEFPNAPVDSSRVAVLPGAPIASTEAKAAPDPGRTQLIVDPIARWPDAEHVFVDVKFTDAVMPEQQAIAGKIIEESINRIAGIILETRRLWLLLKVM
jgi:hypothetical protein